MELVLIASVGRDGAIGRGNELLWRDPVDQRHFRQATMGTPVVMGRKTWESLPERFRPLPGRRNVVVTRQAGYAAPGAAVAGSLDAALQRVDEAPRVHVIGGAQLYALALGRADTLLLTELDVDFPGADAHFPAWDRQAFEMQVIQQGDSRDSEGRAVHFRIVIYRRKP